MASPVGLSELKIDHVANWADEEPEEEEHFLPSSAAVEKPATSSKPARKQPGQFAGVLSFIPVSWSPTDVSYLFDGLEILDIYLHPDAPQGPQFNTYIIDFAEERDLRWAVTEPPSHHNRTYPVKPFWDPSLQRRGHSGYGNAGGPGRGMPQPRMIGGPDNRGPYYRDSPQAGNFRSTGSGHFGGGFPHQGPGGFLHQGSGGWPGPHDQEGGWAAGRFPGGGDRSASFGRGFPPEHPHAHHHGSSVPSRLDEAAGRWTPHAPSGADASSQAFPPLAGAVSSHDLHTVPSATSQLAHAESHDHDHAAPLTHAPSAPDVAGAGEVQHRPKANPFGAARPVDTASKLKEIEEKAKKEAEERAKKEAEERARLEQEAAMAAEAERQRLEAEAIAAQRAQQEAYAAQQEALLAEQQAAAERRRLEAEHAAAIAAQQQAEALLTPQQLEAKRREDAARAFALAQAKAAADAAPQALEVQKAVYELAVQNPKALRFGEFGPDISVPSTPTVSDSQGAAEPQFQQHHQQQQQQQVFDSDIPQFAPPPPPGHSAEYYRGRGGRGMRGRGRGLRVYDRFPGNADANQEEGGEMQQQQQQYTQDGYVIQPYGGRGRGRGRFNNTQGYYDSSAPTGPEGGLPEGGYRGGRAPRGRGGRGRGSYNRLEDAAAAQSDAAEAIGNAPQAVSQQVPGGEATESVSQESSSGKVDSLTAGEGPTVTEDEQGRKIIQFSSYKEVRVTGGTYGGRRGGRFGSYEGGRRGGRGGRGGYSYSDRYAADGSQEADSFAEGAGDANQAVAGEASVEQGQGSMSERPYGSRPENGYGAGRGRGRRESGDGSGRGRGRGGRGSRYSSTPEGDNATGEGVVGEATENRAEGGGSEVSAAQPGGRGGYAGRGRGRGRGYNGYHAIDGAAPPPPPRYQKGDTSTQDGAGAGNNIEAESSARPVNLRPRTSKDNIKDSMKDQTSKSGEGAGGLSRASKDSSATANGKESRKAEKTESKDNKGSSSGGKKEDKDKAAENAENKAQALYKKMLASQTKAASGAKLTNTFALLAEAVDD